jgi:hypothetical protein
MGNLSSKRQRASTEVTDSAFPAQSDVNVDWNDEGSIHRRTALNCLHNYALGKIVEQNLPITEKDDRKRQPRKPSLKFADQIEQTNIYEIRTSNEGLEAQ